MLPSLLEFDFIRPKLIMEVQIQGLESFKVKGVSHIFTLGILCGPWMFERKTKCLKKKLHNVFSFDNMDFSNFKKYFLGFGHSFNTLTSPSELARAYAASFSNLAMFKIGRAHV